jgi:hypothetical protein
MRNFTSILDVGRDKFELAQTEAKSLPRENGGSLDLAV